MQLQTFQRKRLMKRIVDSCNHAMKAWWENLEPKFKMRRCWKENGHQLAQGWWVDWEVMRHVAVLANDQPSNPFGFAKIKSSNILQFILELHCLIVYVVQKGHIFISFSSHSFTPLFLRNIYVLAHCFFCDIGQYLRSINEFKHV